MPPMPKDPKIRQRTNKATTRAVLTSISRRKVPALPAGRAWNPLTEAWWLDTWKSPMAGEFLPADIHALYVLAALVDEFWEKPSSLLAAEIRLQRQCFGLTPLDRRRLEWQIEVTTEKQRKRPPAPLPVVEPGDDPRGLLVIS